MTDISVEQYDYTPRSDLDRAQLKIILSGKDINTAIVNSLVRIMIHEIPTYAFPGELIKFAPINRDNGEKGSIAFNNDYMRLRLSHIPIIGIDPEIDFLHERYWKDVDYMDSDREKHEKEKPIEAYIEYNNTSDDIINVTTKDMKMYINDKETDVYRNSDYPFLIISLKPGEMFKASMKGVLGIGKRNTIWDSSGTSFQEIDTVPGKHLVTIEPSAQIEPHILFKRACSYFKKKIELIRGEIKRIYKESEITENKIEIVLKGENHTMGGPINYELQSHSNIISSGLCKKDHLINEIILKIETFDKSKLLNSIMECIDIIIKKIDLIELNFNKINSNKVTEKTKKTK